MAISVMKEAVAMEGCNKAWCLSKGALAQWGRAWGGCGWGESGREHGESAVEGRVLGGAGGVAGR